MTLDHIPAECIIQTPNDETRCAKCLKPVRLRYPGNDPENGPATPDCPHFHIEHFLARRWDVLASHVDSLWARQLADAPASELTSKIIRELDAVKF